MTRSGAACPDMPSRPGEFHPEPLTDSCMSLSTHTARATHEGCRLPPTPSSSSRYRLAKQVGTRDLLPWLHGHYPVSSLLRSSPPLVGALVLSASWGVHLYLSLGITDPVLTFRTKAPIRVMPPTHRTPVPTRNTVLLVAIELRVLS